MQSMSHPPYIIPKIELRGEPFEIGQQFGVQARSRVLQHLANQRAQMARLRTENPEWWRAEVSAYLAPYEELAPHFVEEMQGLARGAEISFDEALLINVRDELLNSLKPEPVDACTSFGVSGAVTLSGAPILGQTKDTAAISSDLYVVTAIYQKGRPDLLQLAYAGEFGVFGLGSGGMALFGNSIYVAGRAHGTLPVSLLRRLALEANSVDEVIALVARRGVSTPGNMTVGDLTGRVVAIERADQGYGVVEAKDGILTHANHINAPALLSHEVYAEPERSGSLHRQAHLAGQLAAERGRLTPMLAMRCLMDHTNYPNSICRHPRSADDIQTTAAVVVEPTLGRLHAIRGFACQGWPETYTL
jgi:isopenicillin-N N-acyltransferase like protein